ncbi:MAG: SIS domain-containing protein [Eubacteriales bacterium]|nr:SIS domain-containing protein [Eubacteriales bacterium]
MLKWNEQTQLDSVNGALALRGQIEQIAQEILSGGLDTLFFIGIGGTWASCLQAEVHMRARSSLPVVVENAAEFCLTGNRRLTQRSAVVFSSVTGSTKEIVAAIKKCREIGARVCGFVDKADSPIVSECTWRISYPGNEQLKFFMLADRLMHLRGEFPEYDEYYAQMDAHLARALVQTARQADPWAEQYARELCLAREKNPDMPVYFIGAGNQWGATYSHAMCYWEEQLWLRTKSVSCAEFFHGMFEIVDAHTPVLLFMGEDEQRPLAERVAAFLPKVCRNFAIIDTKDYTLEGISPRFRGSISHLVMHAAVSRVDVHLEKELCHPMEIRRYYRQFDY